MVQFLLVGLIVKAICRSVRRFGLMPSQRENITDDELDIVAH